MVSLVLVSVLAGIGIINPGASRAAPGTIPGLTGPTFNLEATDGRIIMPTGETIYMWGFAELGGTFQYPGPNLIVTQGDTVTVNLTNNLTVPVSITFPGQADVLARISGYVARGFHDLRGLVQHAVVVVVDRQIFVGVGCVGLVVFEDPFKARGGSGR